MSNSLIFRVNLATFLVMLAIGVTIGLTQKDSKVITPKVHNVIQANQNILVSSLASNNEILSVLDSKLESALENLDKATRYTHDSGAIKNPQKYEECKLIVEELQNTIDTYERINKILRSSLK